MQHGVSDFDRVDWNASPTAIETRDVIGAFPHRHLRSDLHIRTGDPRHDTRFGTRHEFVGVVEKVVAAPVA